MSHADDKFWNKLRDKLIKPLTPAMFSSMMEEEAKVAKTLEAAAKVLAAPTRSPITCLGGLVCYDQVPLGLVVSASEHNMVYAKLRREMEEDHARAEEIIRARENQIKHLHSRIDGLSLALRDAISTYDPDHETVLVTAERQEAWIAALNS